jgi:hypothetical protein
LRYNEKIDTPFDNDDEPDDVLLRSLKPARPAYVPTAGRRIYNMLMAGGAVKEVLYITHEINIHTHTFCCGVDVLYNIKKFICCK